MSFDSASERIQALFAEAELTDELKAQIGSAYTAFGAGEPPVAVRSSANAEDLPDLSFAGQQDTYLNIRGRDALFEAVRDCWASLWTARAISYRHDHAIAQEAVAMAVVVQVMVPSEVSGILFAANPATGERSEMIVNASFGLGEAIVGGEITPDTYIIDGDALTVKETIIGSKEHMMVSAAGQGTDTRELSAAEREQSSLAAPVLRELAQLAIAVERHFGQPQDIEWAVANGKLWLLQSRPITNLPPAPLKDVRWEKPDMPAWVHNTPLLRKNLVEHIPGPVSPLFEDLYLKDAVGGRAAHGVHDAVNGYAYYTAGTPPGVERWPTTFVHPGSAGNSPPKVRHPRVASGAWRRDRGQGERLLPGGAGDRQLALALDAAPRAAQHRRAAHRHLQHQRRRRHHRRGLAELPRLWPAGQHSELGRHAEPRGPPVHGDCAAAGAVAGPVPDRDRLRPQPVRRRGDRRALVERVRRLEDRQLALIIRGIDIVLGR